MKQSREERLRLIFNRCLNRVDRREQKAVPAFLLEQAVILQRKVWTKWIACKMAEVSCL
jgi:hypothetical protein